MVTDRFLSTVLRAYQQLPNQSETNKIFGSTTSLLTNLTNPLNISLLTSQFLAAPAVWQQNDGLKTCLRIISIYNTAAIHVRRNELERDQQSRLNPPVGSGVRAEAWATAVAKGLNDDGRSARWKHVLVLTGVLMGMEAEGRRSVSGSLRATLEQAVVTAANLALGNLQSTYDAPLAGAAVVLGLIYAFPLLSVHHRQLLDCNAVLPVAVSAMLGEEGFRAGALLGNIGHDIVHVQGQVLDWSPASPSFVELQEQESQPLSQNMGPLSRLLSFAIETATDATAILKCQAEILSFSTRLLQSWRTNKLSTLDIVEESQSLTQETLQRTLPALWLLLKKIMYTIVAVLQPIVGRSLLDPRMRDNATAPSTASKTLYTLRNLYFISSRNGNDAFQAYIFTYLTSLDIITRYPDACASFVQQTISSYTISGAGIPTSALDRTLDLFYLNTVEHLPLALSTTMCDSHIIHPATIYLSSATTGTLPQSPLTTSLFEAAHSSLLSTLSVPAHSELTARIIPFYIDSLLSSFPSSISPRQFRLAFRTVMQIVSPPFPISATHPMLSETLLEMLHFRALARETSTGPLAVTTPDSVSQQQQVSQSGGKQEPPSLLSEQSTLVLALIDALPYLPLPLVEEWLTRTAEAMNAIADPSIRETARMRFWEVLVSGEMDVERAAIGVAWWAGGGQQMVLHGGSRDGHEEFLMSGALGGVKEDSRL